MKILLIRRENVCYSSLDYFLDGLKGGLEVCGADVSVLDVSDNPLSVPDVEVLNKIIDEGFDAALAFNAVGQQNYSINNLNLWDAYKVPFFNYIVDHPLSHNKAMLEHGKNYYVICVDKAHTEYIKRYYPDIKNSYFVPLGGIENDYYEIMTHNLCDYEARDYDILFTGTYIPLTSIEEKINEYPSSVRNLIIKHIEYMLDHRNMSEEDGLRPVLRDMGVNPEEINLSAYLFATKITEEYVKFYLREEIVRYIIDSGINLTIYGNNWEIFDADMKNTICYPGVEYKNMGELYLRSKIVLDHSSHFKYGMHDRIPSAMLAGAAVLTDSNNYLMSEFKEGMATGELCMYDVSAPAKVPDMAYDMLKDMNSLYKMTLKAREKALKKLTWKSRAEELLSIISSVINRSEGTI